ncbi:uncharacterized protein MONBRDRAFT_10544 [Monosiga brevicollis MX1]|uniref:PDZ domain-containing protein n=1 Tax=Monosiga brevicollis TaxID=81824 RepID=A9V6P1_MONBE|nr:uncharacterized protein MONBRDRAFT_10544 [Monosiga brevicollis MX1]EDQ86840.1 predicted protein [Monosiga brevicollis MX1]|eukprot:XP_001748385.1 hypothetical protein [Monosiga brevicollis MX1]
MNGDAAVSALGRHGSHLSMSSLPLRKMSGISGNSGPGSLASQPSTVEGPTMSVPCSQGLQVCFGFARFVSGPCKSTGRAIRPFALTQAPSCPSLGRINQMLYSNMLEHQSTALLTEYSKQQASGLPMELRMEFTLINMMKRIEDTHRHEVTILEDLQPCSLLIVLVLLLHSYGWLNPNDIDTQQFAKRKWHDSLYQKDHENMCVFMLSVCRMRSISFLFVFLTLTPTHYDSLLEDLYRETLKAHATDAEMIAIAAEELSTLINTNMEKRIEEKRQLFKTGFRVLTALQEELYCMDEAVLTARKTYEASIKEYQTLCKKKAKKKVADKEASKLRSLESKAKLARYEYLLELAAANEAYRVFRDEQFPEVADTLATKTLEWLQTFIKSCCNILAQPAEQALDLKIEQQHRADLLSAEFERRTFLHRCRREFPGRQLFEVNLVPGDEERVIRVDTQATKLTLGQLRNLLQHTVDNKRAELATKEEQIESLLSLYYHYTKAGAVLDKGENQARTMRQKMEKIYSEIEVIGRQQAQIKAKIDYITETGVDGFQDDSASDSQSVATTAVIDITEAQEREAERRRRQVAGDSSDSLLAARRQAQQAADNFARTVGEGGDNLSQWGGASEAESTPKPRKSLGLFRRRRQTQEVQLGRGMPDGILLDDSVQEDDELPPPPPMTFPKSVSQSNLNMAPEPGHMAAMMQAATHPVPAAPSPLAMAGSAAAPPPPPPAPAPSLQEMQSHHRVSQTVTSSAAAEVHSLSPGGIDDHVDPMATFAIPPPPNGFASAPVTPSPSGPSPEVAMEAEVEPSSEEEEEEEPAPNSLAAQLRKRSKALNHSPKPVISTIVPTGSVVSSGDASTPVSAAPAPAPAAPTPAAPIPTGNSLMDQLRARQQAMKPVAAAPPPAPMPTLASQPTPTLAPAPAATTKAAPAPPTTASAAVPAVAPKSPKPAPPPPTAAKPSLRPAVPPPPPAARAPAPALAPPQPMPEALLLPMCRALYPYSPMQPDDLALTEREMLYFLVERDDGWANGMNLHGQVGFFPSSYVEHMDTRDISSWTPARVCTISLAVGDQLGLSLGAGRPVQIDMVIPGSPAARAQLRAGDMILEINKRPCAMKSVVDITGLLTDPGQDVGGVRSVTLTVINRNDVISDAQRLNALRYAFSPLDEPGGMVAQTPSHGLCLFAENDSRSG